VIKHLFHILPLALLFLNCSNPAQEPKTPPDKAAAEKRDSSNQESPYPFPVYTSFHQLEPLFERKTDTTYVINFWATWCKPCVAELPFFEQLHQAYQGEKVKVVLVSLDFPRQLKKKLVPFIDEHQLKSEVIALLDGDYNSWIDKISPDWGGAIPVTLIYNAKKRKFFGQQFHDFNDLETALKDVLNI